MGNGVAQHAQADACNPEFGFQRWAPEPREITVYRFRTGLPTVSRRCHPVVLALAGARSAETDELRASDAPSRSSVSPSARCLQRPV